MKSLWTVWWKELLELSRDRRTLVLALVMGPLLAPALFVGLLTMAESRAKGQYEKPMSIVMVGAEQAPNLVAWLAGQGIERKMLKSDPDAAIRNQDEDVYLKIGGDYARHWREGTPALVEIVHDSTRQDAEVPVRRLEAALARYGQQVGALRLLSRGIDPGVGAPLAVSHKDLSTPESRKGIAMAMLPYLLILSAFLGGAYLIIDATAGERERQSLEPLLATPAARGAIVSGKIAAACSVGFLSLLLTLLAFKLGALLAPGIARQLDMGIGAIGKMLLILMPMLFIGTALLTFIAAGAKSVKEAQSYMTFLMLMPMIPTIVLMVSPVKNQLWMFAVPFLAQNQMLLKVVRSESVSPLEWFVYFLAGFGLAAVLWFAATRRYHQEKLAISA
ncbi:sodium transport system permease protein [Luteimonas cucumeris]|uniref:Sodium transport system permease protein n=1 Tax=Luteimonas cucumeris TaxID=985012 RepID=A0A562KUU3_9GAMM|nr:ABC transporter permease [Luteimonas cucumeris]TWH99199.1 sodium transport system permease protein [Luteimonas cucumeris]